MYFLDIYFLVIWRWPFTYNPKNPTQPRVLFVHASHAVLFMHPTDKCAKTGLTAFFTPFVPSCTEAICEKTPTKMDVFVRRDL